MNIFEYPHIKDATKAVLRDLQYKKKSCVIAAMGIGKSAIAINAMLVYSNESILFCAPTHLILEQMQDYLKNMGYDVEHDFKNLQFYTYASLHSLIKKGNIPEFNLLICDEFHAIAKRKQYDSIKLLFTSEKNKRYLGLSATPILQWEYEIFYNEKDKLFKKRVNMASVLYDDSISYYYSIEDAFINDLFRLPIYNEFFVVSENTKTEAYKILKQARVENITEEMIKSLAKYLDNEASFVSILKKYLEIKNTKILFYCRDFKDLLEKELLLKQLFPTLSLYKTSCRLSKNENRENVSEFRNNEFVGENSKVLLSIRQVTEGFHTDGAMQIVFSNKTKAYRDFLQKFGRGCSIGNPVSVKILDLGGNLTRICSLDFLNYRKNIEQKEKDSFKSEIFAKMKVGGNIVDLNKTIHQICENVFVSKREKTDFYYEKILSNYGILKNPEEKYKDGTYLKDWYKEMMSIAHYELCLLKENANYKISEENMYIIETLAYIENYKTKKCTLTEEEKRNIYSEQAIKYQNLLPKNEEYRFTDGTYMASWYQKEKKKVQSLLNRMNKETNYFLSEKNFKLILWIHILNVDLKNIWLQNWLGSQWEITESEKYRRWEKFSDEVVKDPTLLKTKKLCESIDAFYSLEEYCKGNEERTIKIAEQNYSFAMLELDSIQRHILKKK